MKKLVIIASFIILLSSMIQAKENKLCETLIDAFDVCATLNSHNKSFCIKAGTLLYSAFLRNPNADLNFGHVVKEGCINVCMNPDKYFNVARPVLIKTNCGTK